MRSVTFTEVENLCYKEIVKDVLNNDYANLRIKDAKLGNQPKHTFIIGCLQKIVRKPLLNQDDRKVVKCTMREVYKNQQDENDKNTCLCFDILFFDEYVSALDVCLKKAESSEIWFALSDLVFTKYHGIESPWSEFNLRVQKQENSEPRVVLISQVKDAASIKYSLLNSVCHGLKYNIMAVVREIVKETTILKNGSKHTMFKLTDPSFNEFLLHVFFNKPDECFSEDITVGDVILVKHVLGEFYQNDKKMYGKIYSAASLIKYKLSVEGDIIPVTTNTTYTFTSKDSKLVKALHTWWEEKENSHKRTELTNPLVLLRRIEEVKTSMTFHLYCVVNGIRPVNDAEDVILRVADGTNCYAYTSMIDFDDATQQIISNIDLLSFNSIEIDVIVSKNSTVEMVRSLKVGDFVQLYYVSCIHSTVSHEGKELESLEFSMTHDDSKIEKLYPTTKPARDIIRRFRDIESNAEKREHSEEEMSDQEGSEHESVLQQPDGDTHQSGENEEQNYESSEQEAASLQEQSVGNQHQSGENEEQNYERYGLDESVKSSRPEKDKDISEHELQAQEKRKTVLVASESFVRRWKPATPTELSEMDLSFRTECDSFPEFYLNEFIEKSENGDVGKAWAIVEYALVLSSGPTQYHCSCEICFHNWIWGFCSECGALQDSEGLRKNYSKEDLLKKTSLTCPSITCFSSEFVERHSENITTASESVHPFIKLQLVLEDLASDNEYIVDLNGDGAEEFFGIAPSFQWTVASVDADSELYIKGTALMKRHPKKPLAFGLQNVTTSDGNRCFYVCGSRFRFPCPEPRCALKRCIWDHHIGTDYFK